MTATQRVLRGICLASLVLASWTGTAHAQQASDSGWVPARRNAWEQRAVTRPAPVVASQARAVAPQSTPQATRSAAPWAPAREPLRVAQVPSNAEIIPTPVPESLAPIAEEGGMVFEGDSQFMEPDMYAGPPACGGPEICGGCDACCDPYGYFYHYDGGPLLYLLRRAYFFSGVQGFEGPRDVGANGNFGAHVGFNLGAPVGDPWGIGFQVGYQGVISNLAGYLPTADDGNSRDQTFLTAGFFRRAECHGLQGGVVFDYQHDSYYDTVELTQIRSETSWVFGNGHELGYWGAYGLDTQRFDPAVLDGGLSQMEILLPNDIFSLFYRRRFTGGGQGRVFAGGTGRGEGVIGAEASVPLGTSWSLENSLIYVAPKEGLETEESWAVSIQLVWYPGRSSRRVLNDPHHPLFNVADNNVFLLRTGR